ncbi:MAG TPA: CoA transferase [Verrucomicrobiae bacterium]|nr:CoA transferase [Verrucomicrobiae bacterium]
MVDLKNGNHLPLQGLKVVDCATHMAAPWAATYLGDYGADVLKVEHPKTGDTARTFGAVKDGIGIFWKSLARNKKCITLNLGAEEGKKLFLRLIQDADVLIENFRPGTLEKWGLGWDTLQEVNPRLIVLRCSGFGQDGPYSKRGGFGTVAEGMSGFAAMNGWPDGPPTLPPNPLADGVTSIHAALAIMTAIYERDILGSGKGQVIDICLYEPLMRLLEGAITEYSVSGNVAQRQGNRLASAAPRNAYITGDGQWVALSASAQPIAENVFKAIGRPELITDPKFCDNPNRVKNVDELDEIIGGWISQHSMQEVIDTFMAAGAVIGPIYNVDTMLDDPHFQYRESLVSVPDKDFGQVTMPNVVAKFSRTPGAIRHSGPNKGEHNLEIYTGQLGLTPEEVQELKTKGII